MNSAVGPLGARQCIAVRAALALAFPLLHAGCLEPAPGYQGEGTTGASATGSGGTTAPGDGGSGATGTSSETTGNSAHGGTSSGDTATSATGSSGTGSSGTGTGNAGEHLIFVTSGTYAADFGGLTAADDLCQTHADGAGLSGTFVALLSSATVAAKDRVAVSGTIVNLTGQIVAVDQADLWDGTLQNAVTYDEHGVDLPGVTWTGTLADGSIGQTCQDWTSIAHADASTQGNIRTTDSTWVEGPESCFKLKRFYCISQ